MTTPATQDALFAKVQRIIVGELGITPEEVTPQAEFVNNLACDSLDEIELVMAFEEAFDIEIADEDAMRVRTVQDAVTLLKAIAEQKKDQSLNPGNCGSMPEQKKEGPK